MLRYLTTDFEVFSVVTLIVLIVAGPGIAQGVQDLYDHRKDRSKPRFAAKAVALWGRWLYRARTDNQVGGSG